MNVPCSVEIFVTSVYLKYSGNSSQFRSVLISLAQKIPFLVLLSMSMESAVLVLLSGTS